MSYYLAELYSPKAVWLALSPEAREQFFGRIAEGMKGLADMGIEVITMGKTDNSKPHAAEQTYFALWKFPDEQALDALLAGIQATGWHDFFETVNAAGVGTDLNTHLQELAARK